jgi:hypothetical protein
MDYSNEAIPPWRKCNINTSDNDTVTSTRHMDIGGFTINYGFSFFAFRAPGSSKKLDTPEDFKSASCERLECLPRNGQAMHQARLPRRLDD